MRPVAVLIGPPGAGKSTVGRALAKRLGTSFRDTDEVVEDTEGRAIADIFVEEGEGRFRDLERAAVARALAEEPGVVAVGGGAPMDERTASALTGHTVVLLEVGIADAARRVGFDRSRPLLAINPRASWVALLAQRRPTYERLAVHIVSTVRRTPEDVAEEIAGLLAGGENGD